jgi:uncharacterized Zn-binding protein involved in type VI secretion
MPGISLVGVDTAGGLITGQLNTLMQVDGKFASVVGDVVAPHPGHIRQVMQQGAPWFTIDGIPVCHAGDQASCGHSATGQAWFDISP